MHLDPTTLLGLVRRLGPVLVLVGLVAVQLSGGAAAAPKVAEAVPSCPSSALYGHYPHPNCLLKPWTSNQAIPISGTVKISGATRRLKGWYYDFTVVTSFSNPPSKVCPPGATPYADIPCHYATIGTQIIGISVPKATALGSAPVSALDFETPCPTAGPCVRHYQVSASTTYGRLVLVDQVTQGSVTRDPTNDLGVAGFEAAIVVTVPRYTGAPPKCLALGKC